MEIVVCGQCGVGRAWNGEVGRRDVFVVVVGERTSDKGIGWALIGDRDREREPDGASEGEKKGDWK